MTAVERKTRCLLVCSVVEERTFETMQNVVNQAGQLAPGARHFYSDGLPVYATLAYPIGARHEVAPGKSQTYTVEGVNADLRHYLGRLLRRNRCFSRSLNALKQAVWLFAYAYNRRQLFRATYPKLKQRPPIINFLPVLN